MNYPVLLSAIPFYVMANVFPRYIRWNISSIFYGICIHLLLCGFHIILYRIEGFIRDNGPYHILYPLNLRSALHQMKHLMCMELFDACACVLVCMCVRVTHHIWVLIILEGTCYKKCWNDTKENINGSLAISMLRMKGSLTSIHYASICKTINYYFA